MDNTLDCLLDLDGLRYVIDDALGLWVKFDIKTVPNKNRATGIRYSLSLHNRHNERIMGFDNAHAIEYGAKTNVAPMKTFDHWHISKDDIGHPYHYKNAAKLLEDFWIAVNKKLDELTKNDE